MASSDSEIENVMSNDPEFGEECLMKETWDKANMALKQGDYDCNAVGCDYGVEVMHSLMSYDLKNEADFRYYLENSFKIWYNEGPDQKIIFAIASWLLQVKLALVYTKTDDYDCTNAEQRKKYLTIIGDVAKYAFLEHFYENGVMTEEGERVKDLLSFTITA